MHNLLPSGAIPRYAMHTAALLLRGEQGRKIGYWRKPFLGKAQVTGTGYIFGTYDVFIMGCGLAGASDTAPIADARRILLPDAPLLMSYYLHVPEVKVVIDAHISESDEYAKKTLTPELQGIVSDTRSMLDGGGPEIYFGVLMTILDRQRPIPVERAIESFVLFFLYGASLDPTEVQRLWGVQPQGRPLPFMEEPWEDARSQMAEDVRRLGYSSS